jgi:hypothetical protein
MKLTGAVVPVAFFGSLFTADAVSDFGVSLTIF